MAKSGRRKTSIKDPASKLNDEQIKFCKEYAYGDMRGNGVQCYALAYDIDLSEPGAYAGARASVSQLLTKPNILIYIRSIYECHDLNDTIVDNELAFLIKQNADFGSKLGGIKEYNALKTRIKNKIALQDKDGKELPVSITLNLG